MTDKYGNWTMRMTEERRKLINQVRMFFGCNSDSEAVEKSLRLSRNFFEYKDHLRGIDVKAINPDRKNVYGTGYNRKKGES